VSRPHLAADVRSYEDLSANQQKALEALLVTPSIAKAATRAGLGERTIRRYLKDPTFAHVYREERLRLLTEGIGVLQQAMLSAISVLLSSMQDSGDPYLRFRAACATLDYQIKLGEYRRKIIDHDDFEERLSALEQAQEKVHSNGHRSGGY
jgi:hypothetical protein